MEYILITLFIIGFAIILIRARKNRDEKDYRTKMYLQREIRRKQQKEEKSECEKGFVGPKGETGPTGHSRYTGHTYLSGHIGGTDSTGPK